MIRIDKIEQLELETLRPLLNESAAEGYGFIQKLWDEYQSGAQTFSEAGSTLLGGYDGNQMIAIGGIHPDPYLNSPNIGRIRHVYVMQSHRRTGIGGQIVRALINQGAAQFHSITLRTLTAHGDAFYRAIGFSSEPRFDNATHWMAVS